MPSINASIITIGDELLIGQTIDTNSAFIAKKLNEIPVFVYNGIPAKTEMQELLRELQRAN